MNSTTIRVAIAVLIAAAAAACGGGGGGTGATPAGPTLGSTGSGSANTVSVRFAITPAFVGTKNASSSHRSAAATRNAQYVPYYASGVQLVVSATGVASQTLDYAITTATCGSAKTACAFAVPSIASSETITATVVNAAPATPNAQGLGGAFPTTSKIISVGTAAVTLTSGGFTTVSLSMNPVVAELYDCGISQSSANQRFDYNSNQPRFVVTSNVAVTGTFEPVLADVDGQDPYPVAPVAGASPTAQPYVDVNGSAAPVTIVSTSQHFQLYVKPYPTSGTPPPTYPYAQSVSIANTGYVNTNDCGEVDVAYSYDGAATPSGTGATVTVSNTLTAAPPAGLNASPAPVSYATSRAYTVAPVAASAASTTLTYPGPTTVVTGYDPGITTNMALTPCNTSGGTTIGVLSPLTSITAGVETLTFTPTGTGTCTFTLNDYHTNVVSNTISMTILSI